MPEEETDTPSKDNGKDTAKSQENTSGKWQVLEPDIAAAVDLETLMEKTMRTKRLDFRGLKEHMSFRKQGERS